MAVSFPHEREIRFYDIYDKSVNLSKTISLLAIGIWMFVFNATFSNISAIPWRSALVVEEAEVPGENDPEQATGKLYHLRLGVECTLF